MYVNMCLVGSSNGYTCFCDDISHEVVFCLELLDFISLGIMPPPIGAHEVDGLPCASVAELLVI